MSRKGSIDFAEVWGACYWVRVVVIDNECSLVDVSVCGCHKWSEFEDVYANRYFSIFQESAEEGLTEKDNRVLADCMAKKYIAKMDSLTSLAGKNCGPINMDAEKIEGLFTDTPCVEDIRRVVNLEIKAFGKACIYENLTVAH